MSLCVGIHICKTWLHTYCSNGQMQTYVLANSIHLYACMQPLKCIGIYPLIYVVMCIHTYRAQDRLKPRA